MSGRIAEVLIPLPLAEAFDYGEPEGMGLAVGDVVVVPLGPRTVIGAVSGLREGIGVNRPLKPVVGRFDTPTLPATTLAFLRWAAHYAVDAPGQPLAITLRGLRSAGPKPERRLVASGVGSQRPTPARARVLAAAQTPLPPGELARVAGVSSGVVRALLVEGALAEVFIDPMAEEEVISAACVPSLNPSQAAAAQALGQMVDKVGFAVALLDGVTGSGKTEVYMEAAAAVLAKDEKAQVLILLPEIALTQAVIDRMAARIGRPPAEWHSGLSPARRRRTWDAVAAGAARVIVGARSALFLPFARLGLIIVDEEHDGAFKQEEGFIYQARDLAVARGRIEESLVILASATPSLETLWNAQSGRYRWLKLTDRHGGATMPAISLIDLRAEPPASGDWLAPPLRAAMSETLEQSRQCLLFLNRRGYAPLVLCRSCGERLKAPDTDSWLVEHRYSGRLICHLTGFSMIKPARCPYCQALDSLVSVGPGVERIADEARRNFPQARIAVFSSDTVPDAASARALIETMAAGEIDILVATQAAAKGHNFPNLTLVGVVDADLGLRGGDLRAAERTWQLITQVAGRSGRRDQPGRALIQTWAPEHPVMQALAAGDRDGFTAVEMAEREAAGLPPFSRLAAVILSGPNPAQVESFAKAFAAAAPDAAGVDVFGPADPPFGMVRGRRRKRFLVRADRSVDLQGFLEAWRARARPPSAIRLAIDVDPYSFL